MAIDPFSAEIVKLVRNMSDEAILALVKNQLGRVTGSAGVTASASVAPASSKAGRKPGPKSDAGAQRRTPKAAPPPPPPPAPKPPAPRPGLIAAKPAGRPPVAKAAPKPATPAKPAARPTLAKPPAFAKPAPKAAAKPVVKAKPPVKAKAGKRGRGAAAGRSDLLGSVERVVKSSNGMSASEIAKAAGVPQSRVSSALKELKDAKRVFQGGDRRFARYAGDARTAEQASVNARRTAPGPILKKGKRR